MVGRSSGMRRVMLRHFGATSARSNHCCSAGMPSSLYTPCEARSLIDTRPITSSWSVLIARSISGSNEKSFVLNASHGDSLPPLVATLSPLVQRPKPGTDHVFLSMRLQSLVGPKRLIDQLEESAKAARRLAAFSLVERIAHERLQLRGVGVRMLCDERRE